MILVGISVGMPTKQSGVKIYHSGKLAPGQRWFFFSKFSHTGYIDLSKRRVSPEEAIKCEDKFTKSKTVSLIFECD